ncbi:MAG: hypothetical protein JF590_05990 [Gemmatimonadetes bacterium]|nr:hypothetical protein [Gemmatimonadota bacterium]
MRHVVTRLGMAVVLWTAGVTPAAAQLPQIGVPKGTLRVEVGGDFAVANSRLFGGSQPLMADWNTDIGSAFIPELAGADARIRAITGDATYRLSAGRSSVRAATSQSSLVLSAALGLTGRLTLFGSVPFRRVRSQADLRLDSTTANAGLNPAAPQTATFFTQLDAALANLATKLSSGGFNGSTADSLLAVQTLATGTTFRNNMFGLLSDPASASPFVPTATSTAGALMLQFVDTLQARMVKLVVPGTFTTDPLLPSARLSEGAFRDFMVAVPGDVEAILRPNQLMFRQGDAEVGLAYTLFDHPTFRLAASGLVRLPTGLLDRSDNFFDLATGDGQTDLEGRLAADFARSFVGMRVSADYNRQLASTLQRRVFAPSQPLAYQYRLAEVRRDPGDEITLGVEPFIRMAPGFALAFGAFHWHHGADVVGYSGTPVAGVNASDLAIDTDRSATSLQVGMTYSSFAGIRGTSTPVEARWAYRKVVSASGGRVDETKTVWFQFRVFYKLW